MANDGNMTPAKLKAIAALLTERDAKSAAAAAGVAYRTICRWLEDDAFKTELRAASRQTIDTALLRLSDLTGEAVEVLREIMTDKDASAGTRVQAANIALARFLDLRESQELEKRIAALEARNP